MQIGSDRRQRRQIHVDRERTDRGQKPEHDGVTGERRGHEIFFLFGEGSAWRPITPIRAPSACFQITPGHLAQLFNGSRTNTLVCDVRER